MTRRVLPLVVVVVMANVAMLASVLANRSGAPDATIVLTEREVHLQRRSDRDSVDTLQLWTPASRSVPAAGSGDKWLTPGKLAALGVACPPAGPGRGRAQPCGLSRQVFAVYEYDGPAWRAHVGGLERRSSASTPVAAPAPTADDLQLEARYGSRLIAVDAALDATALRRTYPDGRRYLILPAVLRAWRSDSSAPATRDVSTSLGPRRTTFIAPSRFRSRFAGLAPSRSRLGAEPRYAVTLAVGRHHEPWIVAVEPIDTRAPPH